MNKHNLRQCTYFGCNVGESDCPFVANPEYAPKSNSKYSNELTPKDYLMDEIVTAICLRNGDAYDKAEIILKATIKAAVAALPEKFNGLNSAVLSDEAQTVWNMYAGQAESNLKALIGGDV